jgi:HK97 family phage portal protein
MAKILQNISEFFARITSPEKYTRNRYLGASGRTTAGVLITPENALQIDTVWACCEYLSNAIGQCPWQVMRKTDDARAIAENHHVNYLLHVRPNPECTPFHFKKTLMHWRLRHGNGYAEIERDSIGRPVNLWLIHPDRVQVCRDPVTQELYYEVDNGSGKGKTRLEFMDMFHHRGFGDGPVGINVMELAAETLGWAKAVQIFGAAFFGNGMNVGAVIEAVDKTKNLSVEGKQKLEAELDNLFKGPKKSFKRLILDAGMKLTKFSFAPNEGQFIETNYLMVESICRWFGVPPHKVMHLLRATFTNIEHQAIEVVVDSVTPHAVNLEEEANCKLFGKNRPGFYTKINLAALQRGDYKSRQEGLAIRFRNGNLSANEWRAIEDENPLPAGAGGDKYVVQSQMTELSKVGEVPASNDNPGPPPDSIEENDQDLERELIDAA